MAVIITDMNIPKTCGKCFLRCKVGDYHAPVYRCSITGEIIDFSDYISYKQSDCPFKSADEMLNETLDVYVGYRKAYEVKSDIVAIIHKYCDKENKGGKK